MYVFTPLGTTTSIRAGLTVASYVDSGDESALEEFQTLVQKAKKQRRCSFSYVHIPMRHYSLLALPKFATSETSLPDSILSKLFQDLVRDYIIP